MTTPLTRYRDMKAANAAAGQYWFAPDTMAFFGTKLGQVVGTVGSRTVFVFTNTTPPAGTDGEGWHYFGVFDADTASVTTSARFTHYDAALFAARDWLADVTAGVTVAGYAFARGLSFGETRAWADQLVEIDGHAAVFVEPNPGVNGDAVLTRSAVECLDQQVAAEDPS